MPSGSIFRAALENKVFLLHSIVIFSLISVAIWDSTGIIKTFANDNRVTVVRMEIGNDSSAFLQNLTFKIVYHDSALPNAWLRELNISDLKRSSFYEEVLSRLREGQFELEAIDANSSIKSIIEGTLIYSELSNLDNIGFDCLVNDRSNCESMVSMRNYSRILQNPLLEQFKDALMSHLSDSIISTYSDDTRFAIHRLRKVASTMYVEIDPITSDDLQEVNVGLRLIDDPATFKWDQSTPWTTVKIMEKIATIDVLQFEPSYEYNVTIRVKNEAIYNKTITTADCTRDPEILTTSGSSRDYLKAFAKRCGCIPFTDKPHYRKFRDSSMLDLPLCDYQKYVECRSRQGPIRIVDQDRGQFPPSCVVVQNQYTVTVTRGLCSQKMCSNVNFTIKSNDYSRVLFEDRFQLTTAQFVSQLGGDVGLYTGLSVLSMWKLILYVRNRYKKHKTEKNGDGKHLKVFLMELFKELETSIARFGGQIKNKEEPGAKKPDKEGKDVGGAVNGDRDQESISSKMEKLIQEMTKNQQKSEERFTALENQIYALTQLVSKGHTGTH